MPSYKTEQAMKREITFKSLLIAASLFSLLAFVFVNLRSNPSFFATIHPLTMAQNQVETEEATESTKIAVPDVTVLGRLWDITQRLLERAN